MKYLLLSLFSFGCFHLIYSQQFSDDGNTWSITEVNWANETGINYLVKIEGDTVINSHSYKMTFRSDNIGTPDWNKLKTFIRQDGGIVYFLDEAGNEGILYDFDIKFGEEVQLWNGSTATLQSIDSVIIANQEYRKRFHIMVQTGNGSSSGINWIQEIGATGPIPYELGSSSDISQGLGCFYNYNTLILPAMSGYCEGIILSTVLIKEDAIDIFPNPVTDMLSVRLNDATNQIKSIRLLTLDGKLLFQNKPDVDHSDIDMSSLNNSMYILQILTSDNKLLTRKIVKLNKR